MSPRRRDTVRCYVCGRTVPKDQTSVARQRVRSGAVRTRNPFTYRMVRKCQPYCSAEEQAR